MSIFHKILSVSLGALVLLVVALINQYPLITQDTAAYLNMAYAWFFPSDRPAFYGIFIKVVSITKSIWWPVIVQGLLVSSLLVQLMLKVIPRLKWSKVVLMLMGLVILTPVTWIVSQITADIFTAVLILATVLFVLEDNRKWQVVYLFIALGAMLTHNSNTLSMLCFSVVFLLLAKLKFKPFVGRSLTILGVTISAFFIQCSANYVINDEFTFSKAGHIFFMGKMVESGLLKTFLDDNCATENYALCAYKDSLPPYAADFIWQQGKAFHKTGGWHGSKPEYSRIIRATVTRPKYLKFHIQESVFGTIKQVGLTYVGDLLYPFVEGTHPYNLIQQWLPESVPFLLRAKQQQNKLSFNLVSSIYAWTLLLSAVVCIFIFFTKLQVEYKVLLILVLLFIVSNAFVTATFANVIGRLNARVVWVLPFVVGILTLHFFRNKEGYK